MGKRGPPRQYTIKREAYLTPADDKLLDKLRGKLTRSEAIRELIRQAMPQRLGSRVIWKYGDK